MAKKKILFHSNYCAAPTGFGGFMKELLTYLYKTGKYDLTLYASGMNWDHPDFNRWPWRVYGTLPTNPQEVEQLNRDGNLARMVSYGSHYIDRVIQEVKPDIYVGVEDFWGLSYCIDKPWFSKINSMISWTADSLPLLQEAVDKANKIKYHYVWAEFATREFHRLGHTNVKTLRGCVDTNTYRKLMLHEKKELRKKFNIPENCFCVGSLSRNQLRKLWPNLVEGFKIFKKNNPNINTKLLFFTHFSEGWDIPRLIKEFGLDNNDVLCCYKCRKTGEYFVQPFTGQDIDNPQIPGSKSLITVNVGDKLTNEQVNEWYNLLDCFVLPITSGGMERAVHEAKLCELVTLLNPYSCNSKYDNCLEGSGSIELEFSTYREVQTQFIKASVYPSSIAKELEKVYNMPIQKRAELGKMARKWVFDNFSIEVIGKQYEKIFDEMPEINYDFSLKPEAKNPDATIENLEDNVLWVKQLYKKILNMDVENNDSGLTNWTTNLSRGMKREEIVLYFRDIGRKENEKNNQQTTQNFEDLLIKNNKKQFLVVCKESGGDILNATTLLESFEQCYPKDTWNIYFACDPQFMELLDGNPYISKVLPYVPFMESELFCIGQSTNKGMFDGYCHLTLQSQRQLNYLSNSKINI